MAWLAGVCLLPGTEAQSLRIAPQTVAAGDWVTLEIAFQPAGSAPVALQWDVEIPTAALDLEEGPLTRAPLAINEAGKSLNCAVSRKTAGQLLVRCILAGGQKPVPAGTLVVVSLKTGPRAQQGAVRLHLQNAIAVTSDLKPAPVAATESTLTIRPR